ARRARSRSATPAAWPCSAPRWSGARRGPEIGRKSRAMTCGERATSLPEGSGGAGAGVRPAPAPFHESEVHAVQQTHAAARLRHDLLDPLEVVSLDGVGDVVDQVRERV